MLNKKMKNNYNTIVKICIASFCLNLIMLFMIALQDFMFYKKNFSGGENNINQIVNINQTKEQQKEKININDCSFEALKSLPGIGNKKALEIIEARPFHDKYELKSIVGEKVFYNVKDKLDI